MMLKQDKSYIENTIDNFLLETVKWKHFCGVNDEWKKMEWYLWNKK